MEHVGKGELSNISGLYNENRVDLDYREAAQNIGAAIAVVVVIFGWAINKIFRRDLLW